MMHRRDFLTATLATGLLVSRQGLAANRQGVTVFAAASLSEVLSKVADLCRRAAALELRLSFAASSTLARQIEQGARADLFASADLEWMDYLGERGLLAPGSRRNVLTNQLVLVAPRPTVARPRTGQLLTAGFDLAGALGVSGRLAMADPDYVPAGRYGRAALESLGLWTTASSRLARADNVRAALAFVTRGEAPLGIVYATDARAEAGVEVVGRFPDSSHPPIVYPFAVLAQARIAVATRALDVMTSRRAESLYRAAGFGLAGQGVLTPR